MSNSFRYTLKFHFSVYKQHHRLKFCDGPSEYIFKNLHYDAYEKLSKGYDILTVDFSDDPRDYYQHQGRILTSCLTLRYRNKEPLILHLNDIIDVKEIYDLLHSTKLGLAHHYREYSDGVTVLRWT